MRFGGLDAFDSWVGLNARVRHALDAEGDASPELSFGRPLWMKLELGYRN